MAQIKKYKLTAKYEIQAFMQEENEPNQTYYNYTNERLSIEETFDLNTGKTLPEVLGEIDAIHQNIRALVFPDGE